MMAKQEQTKKSNEHWMQSLWRPSMGWTYMVINIFDFILAPAFVLYLRMKGIQIETWKSLTLDGGGFIHIAFGAILGVAAYGRTQEKTASIAQNSTNDSRQNRQTRDDDREERQMREERQNRQTRDDRE